MIEDLGVIDTRKIIATVVETHGIDFSTDALTALRYRFISAMNQLQVRNVDELCFKLNNPDVFDLFLEKVTVDVTEFFRDPSFWRELKKIIFPRIREANKYRIWFPDCSSGEELYSLLIFLEEEGLGENVEIIASQFSKKKNGYIKEGLYSHTREDINSANYKRANGKKAFADYIETNNKKFLIKSKLLEIVTFKTHKSIRETREKDIDLVMFRNTLIYYNKNTQNDIIEHILSSMKNQGTLVIGAMETLNILNVESKFRELNKAERIYQKIAK